MLAFAFGDDKKAETSMKSFLIIGCGVMLLIITGCATERISDYQPPSPSNSERIVQMSGLEVAVDPFVEKQRTEEYFDMNAVGNCIAILHVRVFNHTSDKTFLVEKKDFTLHKSGSTGGAVDSGNSYERSKAGDSVALIGAVGGSFVGAMIGASMVSHASEVERNFVSKEMDDQTLSPGQSMEGFIYFSPVKKGEDWTHATIVNVNLTDTRTQQKTELNIPL